MSGDATERLEASSWFWSSDLLERAGLEDVLRASGNTRRDPDGTISFSVRTTSRGRVVLGTIPAAVIEEVAASLDAGQLAAFREHVRDAKAAAFDIVQPYAEHLEANRRAPLEPRAAKSRARRREAWRLYDEGYSRIYIARALNVAPKTVRRYLEARESGTFRETPG